MSWEKTDYQGVYIRKLQNHKHGIGKDLNISIRFQFNGKNYHEVVGRASKNNTPKKAFLLLSELKENQKKGTPPFTLKDRTFTELAKEAANEMEKARVETDNVTFKSYFENSYLPIQKTHKGQDTWIKETGHAENWIYPVIGNIPIKNVSSFHIERIKKNLLDAGRTPRTVQYCLATIRQTWNHARRAGIVSGDSPTRAVKIPKFDNQRQRYLTPDECSLLLAELKIRSETIYCMALLSLDAGLRFSEIAGLQWQDIDIIRETVLLRDTKSGKNRTVYMTERIKCLFSGMPKSGPDALVFPDRNGKARKEVGEIFRLVVEKLGLNSGIDDDRLKCVFHSLRHTHASRLLESGADIYRVKELLGHAHVTTTERYSHVTADRLRSAIKDMEKMHNQGQVIPLAGRTGE